MPILWLHVGLMKTGTTYLQGVLRANADLLSEQGVRYPFGDDAPVQRFAVWDVMGRQPKDSSDHRTTGQWAALVAWAARRSEAALVSEEYLAGASARQVKRIVESFPGHEVHVVLTARDLARVVPSDWQETVKSGRTHTWAAYVDALGDPARQAADPARSFWRRHDLLGIADIWAEVVGPERVHVVTVPPAGAAPGLLLERMAGLVGFDPAALTAPPRGNESLSPAATEMTRRLNERIEGRVNQRQYDRVVKMKLLPQLPPAPGEARAPVPPAPDWLVERSTQIVTELSGRGYDVVGDIEDLRVTAPAASASQPVGPSGLSSEELLEASLTMLAESVEAWSKLWWRTRASDEPPVPVDTSAQDRLAGGLRRGGYRLRRRGADLADRNRVARWAMGLYLRRRR